MGHIYFVEEGEAPVVSTSAPAPVTTYAHCCSRARVDYNAADPCYVFKAVRNCDSSLVAASLSNNAVKLYYCSISELGHTGDIAAHQGTISDIQFPLPGCPHALYTCSRDGHVKAWDLRSKQQAER
eukprot:GHRR01023616.1.p1 GENE.GHRR01023616.1~~GHRR01023616.1.p1  ORF type:complete len:126 (+),score=29.19 GHRR01023616.1:180-557(+)